MKKHSLSIILFLLCLVMSDVFSQTRVDWRQIKSTPTTIEGYGITNAISTNVLDNALATFTEEVVRIDSEIATITNELERVENLIPNNASFTFQGLSETVGTVGNENLANYSVTTVKLATDSVTTEKILDDAVTTEKILDGAVTDSKIDSLSSRKLTGDITTDDASIAIHTDVEGNYPPTIHRADTVTKTRGLYLSGGDKPVSEGMEGFNLFLGSATDPYMRAFAGAALMMQMFPPSIGLNHPISFKEPVIIEGDLQISNKLGIFNYDAENSEAYDMSLTNDKGEAILDMNGYKLKLELDSHSVTAKLGNSANKVILREETPGYMELVTPNNAILTLKGGEVVSDPLKAGKLDLYRGQAALSVEDTSTSRYSNVLLDAGDLTSQASNRLNLYAGDSAKLVLKDGVASLTGKLNVSGDTVIDGKLTVDGVNGLRVTGGAGAYIDSVLGVGGDISHGSTTGSTPNLVISGGAAANDGSTLELSTGFRNKIELKTADGDTKITMEDGLVTVTDKLEVTGDLDVKGRLKASDTVGFDFLKTLIDSFSCAEFEQYPALLSAPVLRLITMPSELTTPHIFEWINASYSVGVATYTDGPAHGKDSNAFFGSTLMPNGKVMLTPHHSANIGIYDPIANTYTDGPLHGKGNYAFAGSTLMPNGKVMLTPRNSANIGIYDPIANTYTDGPAHGKDSNAFAGSVLMPNGKVMLTPHNSANIGIYDPIANTYTDGPAHRRGANAFYGSVMLPNGKVMLTPSHSSTIGIYDPIANTYTNGPAHGQDGGNAFFDSTLMPNGKVILAPSRNSANIGIYDPIANTYTNGPTHGQGEFAFSGSVLMPNGKVMLTPCHSANIGIYDPITDTYTDGPLHGKGNYAFAGSTLMPNGKVMLTPRNSANIGIYDPAIIDLELRDWPLLSAYFNKL